MIPSSVSKPVSHISFPTFTGIRCLMMPYIQGDPESVPEQYRTGYESILEQTVLERGSVGYLTIDESRVAAGSPHRGARARFPRALHTEVGRRPGMVYAWGGGGWGHIHDVFLEDRVQILLANTVDESCAVWDARVENTSDDGDIGYLAHKFPYTKATLMKAGDVHQIGILTPHESLPVVRDTDRQFLRIVGRGVHGREPYFTENPLVAGALRVSAC